MQKPLVYVECKTAEEVHRALYLGHAITCSEEVAEQCGASYHQEGVDAFTREEIMESHRDPYGDGRPLDPSDYDQFLK